MNKMRIPTRPAPSIEEAFRQNNTKKQTQQIKKKPPPRPPPPNFEQIKSKSAWNLNQQFDNFSLIDLSPPESPNHFVASRNRAFGGSVSSSFSSSTSSLASSKKSFEYDSVNVDPWTIPAPSNTMPQSVFYLNNNTAPLVPPQISVPTIIRPQNNRKNNYKPLYETCQRDQSPPMPSVPPPSPPKDIAEVVVPYGIALYDYPKSQPDDLALQVDEVVFLLRRINSEWFYGRVEDREGMFPVSFISVQVPLPEDDRMVTAVYEFKAQEPGDLSLRLGQTVHVTSRVSEDWLIGESEGKIGQFPTCFVDRIPSTL